MKNERLRGTSVIIAQVSWLLIEISSNGGEKMARKKIASTMIIARGHCTKITIQHTIANGDNVARDDDSNYDNDDE